MKKRTFILTEQQLSEILGTNMSYLDNVDSDFAQNGSNEVYTGEKTDTNDAEPITTDKYSKARVINFGPWMTGGRSGYAHYTYGGSGRVMESNSDLEGTTLTIDNDDPNGKMSYTAATTKKSEMEKLKNAANKGDKSAETQFNNRGGDETLNKINRTLDNKTGLVKRWKQNKKNMGDTNAFQKPGGTKNAGNGQAHTKKVSGGFLHYFDNE